MNAMTEVFPMIAGVLTGFLGVLFVRIRSRIAVWAVMTVAFGALATYLSGEYRESWAFILLDMAWVGGISYAVVLGITVYRRRSSGN